MIEVLSIRLSHFISFKTRRWFKTGWSS